MSLPVQDAHAFLAPSAAARWVVCPGSGVMEARYPEQGDKEAAAEGTATHWIFQQLHEGWAPEVLMQDGKAANGVQLVPEMMEAAQLLLDDVRDTLAPYNVQPIVETRVAIPRVHPTANWGTPDVRAWAQEGMHVYLFLWDLKYGHKHVEVFENWQLIDYAAGCLSEAQEGAKARGLESWPEHSITIVFRVVQPRSYHRDGPIREWRINAAQLAPYVHRLAMAADEATGPDPQCKPRPDACENCSARHACDALQRAAYRGMDLARQAQASELSPIALGLEARYLEEAGKLMDARLTGLKTQIDSLQRQGLTVPHWMMAPKGARLAWNKPAAEVLLAGELLGLSLAKDPEPITPTQAKAKGFPPSLLNAYAFTPSGAMQLTLDDGSAARKTFSK